MGHRPASGREGGRREGAEGAQGFRAKTLWLEKLIFPRDLEKKKALETQTPSTDWMGTGKHQLGDCVTTTHLVTSHTQPCTQPRPDVTQRKTRQPPVHRRANIGSRSRLRLVSFTEDPIPSYNHCTSRKCKSIVRLSGGAFRMKVIRKSSGSLCFFLHDQLQFQKGKGDSVVTLDPSAHRQSASYHWACAR